MADQAARDAARLRWQAVRPPKLPLFTGDSEGCELEDFAREARRIIHHYALENLGGESAEWMIQSLEGAARREVTSRPPADTATADLVLAALQESFGDHRTKSAMLSTFHSRRQGNNEGVLNYAQTLHALQARLNNLAVDTVTDEALRDRFVDGLQPPALRRDIRRFIREREDADFTAVRAEALRWMREDADCDVRSEQVTATPARSSEVDELRHQVAELVKQTAALRTELNQRPAYPEPSQNHPSHFSVNHPSHQLPASRPRCWLCSKYGHLQARCPLKRQILNAQSHPDSHVPSHQQRQGN
ncbi:uncharacterized protein [Littorina saxatilis]|uniref:uncharacterized protein n=1 Tax=Littorina saxatilis TaxID=31220 RepID=UPI0038B46FDD